MKITSGVIQIFMSSDGQSIPFGNNWVHKIEEGLNNAKIMFVFVTPTSIESGWIYFEAGFAYSKGIEVYQRQQDGNLPPVRYRLDDPLQEDRRIWPLIVK